MNYYEHHLADYTQATAHLSFLEDAAYSRMLRWYYANEKPLPVDIKKIERLVRAHSEEEREAVRTILDEFFTEELDGWHQDRADQEIARYQDKQRKASASANARWSKQKSQCEVNADAMQTHMQTQCEGNAPQTPDPRPHYSIQLNARAREDFPEIPTDPMQWTEFFVNAKGFQIHVAQTAKTIPMFKNWVDRKISVADVEMAITAAETWRQANGETGPPGNLVIYKKFLDTVLANKDDNNAVTTKTSRHTGNASRLQHAERIGNHLDKLIEKEFGQGMDVGTV